MGIINLLLLSLNKKLSLTQRWIFNSLFSTHITVPPSRMFQLGTSLRHSQSISKRETRLRCQSGLSITKLDVSRILLLMTKTGFTLELPQLLINSTSEVKLVSTPSENITVRNKETELEPNTQELLPVKPSDMLFNNSKQLDSSERSHMQETVTFLVNLLPRKVPLIWTELPLKLPKMLRVSRNE